METGEAQCWMYAANDIESDFFTDEWFEKNRLKNKKLALKTLDYILNENKNFMFEDEEHLSEEEIKYYKDLKAKIEAE